MKKFNYTMNHKADEEYMAKMCHEGFAATRLVEGFWTFEPCEPDMYTYRVCYLRGKSRADIENLKKELAEQGIEFVFRYSFWAIFRSRSDFRLYSPEEELDVCERIRRPMIPGSVMSFGAAAALVALSVAVSPWFALPAAVVALYGVICACLCASYTRLIGRLRGGEKKQ